MKFWKPSEHSLAQTWLVVIGGDVFEMDEGALNANGVNMYSGPESELDRSWISGSMECEDNIRRAPGQIVRAALLRADNILE